jgi:hypothetical protein
VSLKSLAHPLQESVNRVMEHLGPALAEALVYNISGNSARSELDKISDPLKKLVVKQVQSKSWLEAALFGKNLPGNKIEEGDRRIFLQKIMTWVTSTNMCLLLQTSDFLSKQASRSKANESSRERLLVSLPRIKLCICFMRIEFTYMAFPRWF